MILFLQILNAFNEFYINPQEYLILYFAILGILVTLISISGSLTKEVRQDLINEYYLKSKFVTLYSAYIILTFISACLFYYFEPKYLNAIIFILFILTFLCSFIFSGLFILRLKREWLYSQIFEHFKKEINSKKELRKESSNLNYSRTQFKSLDALIKNFSYIEKNNQDFIEEVKLIKMIVEYCIANDKQAILVDFFTNDVIRIKNASFFENLILMLYELKFKEYKNLVLVRQYQNFLYDLVKENFYSVKEFNTRLNTSGLYLREFLDVRNIEEFKKTENMEWINNYETLIANTTSRVYDLCRLILSLDIEPKTKKRYLLTQLSDLNQILEHHTHLHEIDFIKEYYDRSADSSKKELADRKMDVIKRQQEYLKEKQSDIFYLILYNIDKDNLPKNFFEIALRIYKLGGFKKQYYKHERFDKLDWLNYDWFTGGGQAIAPFNFNRYRLLMSFYNYLDTGQIDIKEFENENFTDTSYPFEKELDNPTEMFISKYFDYDKKKFKKFRKLMLKEIKEKKESIIKDKKEYIIKTPLKDEYVTKFINDCKEAWESNQKNLSEFMYIQEISDGYKIKTFFGQYILFNKDWFLDSFDKNVGLARVAGKDFGQSQGTSKIKKVLDLINKLYNANKDEEVIIKDAYSDLAKVIQPNKEYYLFYSSDFKIYNIPKLNWNRRGIENANLNLNNSIIHFCYSYNPESLLFEKGAFILKQYKQGYEKINEPLVVKIEQIDKDEDIKKILAKNKDFKSEDDVKQMVKIRIAEKFEVERSKNAKLIRIKL